MKILLRFLMAFVLAVAGVTAIHTTEVAAQQPNFKGKKGGGPGVHHGGGKHHGGKHHHGNRNRGGKIAGGIAAGIAAGLILNEISRSQAATSDRGDGPSCRELRFRCDDGSDWACRRHARRC